MPAKWPWIERRFTFDFPVGKYPDILERFRGTPVRIEERVRGVDRAALVYSDGGWTILQNIGHLLDLEPLWEGRVDDFLAGQAELRAADLTNRRTHEAKHNEREIGELLGAFRRAREAAAERTGSLRDADWARTSVHPRLKVPMRMVDALAFACEHDDYHLARIGELVARGRAG
jgi:uncharacterized damage-inducible protein DinB